MNSPRTKAVAYWHTISNGLICMAAGRWGLPALMKHYILGRSASAVIWAS